MRKTIFIAAILTAAIFASGVLAATGGSGTAQLTANVACTASSGQCTDPTPVCTSGSCVAATCGVTASSGLDFGSLTPGATSGVQQLTVTNNGNVPTTSFAVSGDYWYGTYYGPSNWMPIGQTQVSQDGTNYYPLTSAPGLTGFGMIGAGAGKPMDFTLTVPVNQANDNYAQTITFTSGC